MAMVMGTDRLSPEPGTGSPRTHLLLAFGLRGKRATIACRCKVNLLLRNSILTANCTPLTLPPAPLYSPSTIKQRCHSGLSADSFRTPPRRRAPEISFCSDVSPNNSPQRSISIWAETLATFCHKRRVVSEPPIPNAEPEFGFRIQILLSPVVSRQLRLPSYRSSGISSIFILSLGTLKILQWSQSRSHELSDCSNLPPLSGCL
jgi:hypothetical protein